MNSTSGEQYYTIRKEPEVTNSSISAMFLTIANVLHSDEYRGVEIETGTNRSWKFDFQYLGTANAKALTMRFGNLEYKCIAQPANGDTDMGKRVLCGIPITWFIRKTWEGETLVKQDWLGHVEGGEFLWNFGVEELLERERQVVKLSRATPTKDDSTEVVLLPESGLELLVDSVHRRVTGLPQID